LVAVVNGFRLLGSRVVVLRHRVSNRLAHLKATLGPLGESCLAVLRTHTAPSSCMSMHYIV
jgi:hypothetical protein